MSDMNQLWVLKKRPVGDLAEGDLELVERPLDPLKDGEVRVRTIYLSLDPTNRNLSLTLSKKLSLDVILSLNNKFFVSIESPLIAGDAMLLELKVLIVPRNENKSSLTKSTAVVLLLFLSIFNGGVPVGGPI